MEIEKRYTDKEFCLMFQIDRATSKRWRDKKLVGFIQLPTGGIRYRQQDIDQFEQQNGRTANKGVRRAA